MALMVWRNLEQMLGLSSWNTLQTFVIPSADWQNHEALCGRWLDRLLIHWCLLMDDVCVFWIKDTSGWNWKPGQQQIVLERCRRSGHGDALVSDWPQRAIIRDRQTGKTTIAVMPSWTQKGPDYGYIAALVRKNLPSVRRVETLRQYGAGSWVSCDQPHKPQPSPSFPSTCWYNVCEGFAMMTAWCDCLCWWLVQAGGSLPWTVLLLRRPPGREAFQGMFSIL